MSKITNFEPSISWLVITHPDGRDSSAVDRILTNSGDRHFLNSLRLFGVLEEPHRLEQRRVQSLVSTSLSTSCTWDNSSPCIAHIASHHGKIDGTLPGFKRGILY